MGDLVWSVLVSSLCVFVAHSNREDWEGRNWIRRLPNFANNRVLIERALHEEDFAFFECTGAAIALVFFVVNTRWFLNVMGVQASPVNIIAGGAVLVLHALCILMCKWRRYAKHIDEGGMQES